MAAPPPSSARMSPAGLPRVINHLPRTLRRRGVTWGDLARRTLLSPGQLSRVRGSSANPRLVVAERVAAALGVPIEEIWQLAPPRPPRIR
jgi:transcriptional regulator with XRE-family HTH domain